MSTLRDAHPKGIPEKSPLSRHEAHPFEPDSSDPESDRCALCGESRNQIRHHPARIAAACLMKGLDPATVLGRDRE